MSLEQTLPLTAKKLIEKFGLDATYTVFEGDGAQVYNENTGLYESSIAEIPYSVKVAPPRSATPDLLTDGSVVAEDLVFELAGLNLGFEPKPNDRVTVKGKTYTVKTVRVFEYNSYYLLVVTK